MKTKVFLIPVLIILTGLYSCDDTDTGVDLTGAVKFTSSIATLSDVQNRAANTQWTSGDQIGIYMKSAGQVLADATIAEDATNRAYKAAATAADAEFKPSTDDQTIYYPMDEAKNVDFIAYYPYTDTKIADYVYAVDVSDQTKQADIDLLYSNNVTRKNKSNTTAALEFSHKLSKVILNIQQGKGTATDNLSAMTVVFKDMNTQATMALTDGEVTITPHQTPKDITLLATAAGQKYEAILLPENLNNTKVEFHLNNSNNEVFVWTIGSDINDLGVFEPGTKYTYTITLDRTGVTASATIVEWKDHPENLTGTAN